MPGGITLLMSDPADIETPAAGKVTVFIDSTGVPDPIPSYKDEAGNTFPLGTTGATGPAGASGPPVVGIDGADGFDGIPASASTPMVSLGIDQTTQPATLDITASGTLDWLSQQGTVTIPRQLAAGSNHCKAAGGWLMLGFDWIVNGGTIFTQNDTMQISDTLTDSCANAVFTNSIASQGILLAAGVGIGWRLTSPASYDRVATLKIYCSAFSAVVTVTATMANGLSTSLTFDTTAATTLARTITVTYQGGPINVKAQMTTNRGSTPNVKFQAATLS